MRKLVLLPIIAILTISIGVNSVLLMQQTSKLGEISSGIDSLGGKVSTLTGDVSTLQSNLSGLQGSLSGLQGGVSSLQGSVAGLQGGVSILQGNVSSLQLKLTNSESKVSTLQADLIKANADIAKFQAIANVQPTIPLTALIKLVEPTVVLIETSRGSGSGIIISQTGYVLTAAHVVTGFSSANITLVSGERYSSTVIARNATRDIAIIKITSPRTNFPEAVLGSSGNISVGEEVVAAGYPLNLRGLPFFTVGTVSHLGAEADLNYIYTPASINAGNSGGPLFNFKGQVIGVIVAKYVSTSVEGIGLAIPIDETKTLIQNSIK